MLVTDRLDQVHYLPHLHVEVVFVEDGRVVWGYGFFSIYYCMICITSSFDAGRLSYSHTASGSLVRPK